MADKINQELTVDQLRTNFPFPNVRPMQDQVLQEICDALNEGYKTVVLEAPTVFSTNTLFLKKKQVTRSRIGEPLTGGAEVT
jgi:hypothetical protein